MSEASVTYWRDKAKRFHSDVERLRAEVERLKAKLRWNIEEDGNDLLICDGVHEKDAKCEYVRYTRAAEIERLRAALAWYADEQHYIGQGNWPDVFSDNGTRARAALGGTDDTR